MTTEIDVVIIGAGAAGMMCAATAAQRGRGVVLIDHATVLAEKIRISGGGRCNFTNINARPECYLSQNPHFSRSALAQYSQRDFIGLVERYGIGYHEKKLGQLFCDDSAQNIIDMLKTECDQAGVQWRMGTSIGEISHDGTAYQVRTSREHWRCASLVVACGGLSIPPIGATGLGYDIARQFDLTIVPTAPALVPLSFDPKDLFADLSGISLDVSVQLAEGKAPAFRENVLLTHKGVSGPAILQISSYWNPGDTLRFDLLPDHDAGQLLEEAARSEQLLGNVLSSWLPKRFATTFCEANFANKPLKQYTPKERAEIAARLHDWRVKPNGSVGYKKAEVTRGGVDTRALSSKTMMANRQPGLYFIGEVTDVTGWLGGYNFQWAWSSGVVAGWNC